MPPIKDMTGVNLSGYIPAPVTPPPDFQPEQSLLPRRSPLLRSSAIYIPGTFPSSDSLTGYHIGGVIPQYRSPLPPPATAQGAGSTTNQNILINSPTSSSSTTVISNAGIIQSASLSLPTMNPGGRPAQLPVQSKKPVAKKAELTEVLKNVLGHEEK